MLKPRMNPIEFTITRRIRCACGAFSSSRPAPEIRERYPGTRGSTHGERNEMSPAKKAASGSGRLVMCSLLYLYSSSRLSSSRLSSLVSQADCEASCQIKTRGAGISFANLELHCESARTHFGVGAAADPAGAASGDA